MSIHQFLVVCVWYYHKSNQSNEYIVMPHPKTKPPTISEQKNERQNANAKSQPKVAHSLLPQRTDRKTN